MPDVTVVLPTRDRADLLRRSVASVLAQVDVDLELVVVDDGSRDDTRHVLDSFGDARLRPIGLQVSAGVGHARNLGIAAARGPWLAFLDDDDFWAPTKLRRQLELAETEPDALVYTAVVVVDADGSPRRVDPAAAPGELEARLLEVNAIGTPSSVLVPTELVRGAGGFDERLSIFADWDLWLRLLPEARPFAVTEPLTAYTEHPQNMHAVAAAQARTELRYLRRKHRVRLGGLELSRWLLGVYRARALRLDCAREYAQVGLRHRSLRDLARAAAVLAGPRALRLGVAIAGPAPADPPPPPFDLPGWLASVTASPD